jgi:hypothetical protein
MNQLDTKKVVQASCGDNFAIALGQTIRQPTGQTPGKDANGMGMGLQDD